MKKASQFYHVLKELLKNEEINEKCILVNFKIYFKIMLLYGAKTWKTPKREDSKTQVLEALENNLKTYNKGQDMRN